MVNIAQKYKYISYNSNNYRSLSQFNSLSDELKFEIDVVSRVLPFKVNSYVANELINWEDVPNDPMYRLAFPQKGMLSEENFDSIANLLKRKASNKEINQVVSQIRANLNPHSSGQMDYNLPIHNDKILPGAQHKYRETVLFFPEQSQTCYSYCTFCFRWSQLVGSKELKFSTQDLDGILDYIRDNESITDLLITGGDPMVMSSKVLGNYIDKILKSDIKHLTTIRIGSKSLSFWPQKYVYDKDSDAILRIFDSIVRSGRQLSFMAHFNHYREMSPKVFETAVQRIKNTGAQIRTQSPIFNHINASPVIWEKMWKKQVRLGLVPYYMFIPRDTGAHDYFKVSLVNAWDIFRKAYQNVGGTARTVRGPVMSAGPGKIQVLGTSEVAGVKVITLRFIQARNPNWVHKPFFAEYDSLAYWLDDIKPAFGEKEFFFEKELNHIYTRKSNQINRINSFSDYPLLSSIVA